MKPYDYQIKLAEKGYKILENFGVVYFAMEERTGKTIISILAVEKCEKVKTVLVITKKAVVPSWIDTLKSLESLGIIHKKYEVVNYHQAHKYKGLYDCVILDESHNYISSYPKKSKIWEDVKYLTFSPYLSYIVYISATPYAQGMQQLYHQFALSSSSPFKEYKNFYIWYNEFALRDAYGSTDKVYTNFGYKDTYKKVKTDVVWDFVKHLFVVKTRKELGFTFEPQDSVHYIKLDDRTKVFYNKLLKNRVIKFHSLCTNNEEILVADSVMKLRVSLHMLEGGVLKIDEKYLQLQNTEKIDYIKKVWGDVSDLVIMYYFVAEKEKLEKHFQKARILQSTTYAEGIDLASYKHLVVYSQCYSTSKHIQRRARQSSSARKEKIVVHFLLVNKAVSDEVYTTVSKNKKNYTDKLFIGSSL